MRQLNQLNQEFSHSYFVTEAISVQNKMSPQVITLALVFNNKPSSRNLYEPRLDAIVYP